MCGGAPERCFIGWRSETGFNEPMALCVLRSDFALNGKPRGDDSAVKCHDRFRVGLRRLIRCLRTFPGKNAFCPEGNVMLTRII